jgi:hypothetical protein
MYILLISFAGSNFSTRYPTGQILRRFFIATLSDPNTSPRTDRTRIDLAEAIKLMAQKF